MAKQLRFNATAFLRDFNLPYSTDHHHCSSNRIQTHCPFCEGSRNYHLGIHLTNAYGNCWRCGPHSIFDIILKLLHCSKKEVFQIIDQYNNINGVAVSKNRKRRNINSNFKFKKPGILIDLNEKHKKYLKSRNFSISDLKNTWGLKSIGPIGEYKHRIFIPITYMNNIVSFQGRAASKHAKLRYKTCNPKNEAIHHKNILYGSDNVPGDTVVVVEGVTDVWRLGPGAVATFGTAYTQDQVLRLSIYSNVFIMFDNDEPNAQIQARQLANDLAYMKNKNIKLIKSPYKCDPADLSQSVATELMGEILSC